MSQGTTVLSPPRATARDPGQVRTATWMDPLLLALGVGLLSPSILSGPRLPGSYVLVLAVLCALGLQQIRAKGSTGERIERRRLVLFIVILVNTHAVGLASAALGPMFGLTLLQLEGVVGLVGFGLVLIRSARLRAFGLIRTPLDLTVLVLLLLVSLCFLGLHTLLRLNGLAVQLRSDLSWIVLVATLLYFILGSAPDTDAGARRGLRLALLPLAGACLSFAFWIFLFG